MGKSFTQEEAENKSLSVGFKLIGKYTNSWTKTEFICPKCNQIFKTIPNNVWQRKTTQCKKCEGHVQYTQQEAEEKSLKVGIKLLGKYTNSITKTEFECPICKLTFYTQPISIWTCNTTQCQKCAKNKRLTQKEAEQRTIITTNNTIKLGGTYINSHTKCEFICFCDEKFQARPYDIWNKKVQSCGCKKHQPSYNRSKLIGQKFGKLTVVKLYGVDKDKNLLWTCLCECGNYHIVSSHSLKRNNTKSCGNCHFYQNGKRTSSLNIYLQKLINGIHNYRICDIDLCIDNAQVRYGIKFAIEIDPWFWHGYKITEDNKRRSKLHKLGWKTITIRCGQKINWNKLKILIENAQLYLSKHLRKKSKIIMIDGWGKGQTYKESSINKRHKQGI